MSDEASQADQSRAQMDDLLSKIDDLHAQMRGVVLDYARSHGVSMDDANAPTSPTPVVPPPDSGVLPDPVLPSSSPMYEGGAGPVDVAPQADYAAPAAIQAPLSPEHYPHQEPGQIDTRYAQAQIPVEYEQPVQVVPQASPQPSDTAQGAYSPADQGEYGQNYSPVPQVEEVAQPQPTQTFDPYAIPVAPATPPQFTSAAFASQPVPAQTISAEHGGAVAGAPVTAVPMAHHDSTQFPPANPAPSYAAQGAAAYPEAPGGGYIPPSQDPAQVASGNNGYVPLQVPDGFVSSLVKKVGEGKIGTYLLSGAAALLVFLAAGSLIALLWNQIPDWVKVASVGLIGVALTVVGFLMTQRPTKNRALAATIMGIGGGLVFIALTGAALLKVLSLLPAFLFLAAWTIILIALAVRTRLLFMAVVAAIGGIATVILTHVNGFQNPNQAFIGLIMTTGYVAALTATTGMTGRFITTPSSRPWYPMSALAVAIPALFFAPVNDSWRSQHAGTAIALAVLFGLILLLCAFIAYQGGLTDFYPQMWSSIWVFAPITGTFATMMLTLAAEEHARNPAAIAFSFFIVMMLAGAAGAVKGSPLGNHHWVSASLFSTVTLMYLILGSGDIVGPFLPLFTFALMCLSATASIMARTHYYAWVIPVAALFMPTFAGGGVAAIVMALVSLLAIGFAVLIEKLVDPHPSFVHLTWVVIAIVLLRLPYFIGIVTSDYTASSHWGWTAAISTSITMLIVMIVLGLSASIISPLPLLTGRQWLHRPTLPSPQQQFTPDTSTTLWLPTMFTVIGLIQVFACLITLAWRSYDLPSFFVSPFILAVGAALTWMNWPLVRNQLWGILTGIVMTICLTVPVAIISGADSSWPWTVAALLAGAGSILVGFYAKSTALRLYGLILVILMVLKFAAVDIGSQNSLERIAAFAFAGLICLALSVLYSRLTSSEKTNRTPTTPSLGAHATQPHVATETTTVQFRPDPDAQFRPDAQAHTPYYSTGTPSSPGESPS
ncbi:MAG: DUF2339 domain-containing protein [Actinomycetaceae bacterium]|nr:DUF2339 domain-containing protein [Actinomycetaceae bacterium]